MFLSNCFLPFRASQNVIFIDNALKDRRTKGTTKATVPKKHFTCPGPNGEGWRETKTRERDESEKKEGIRRRRQERETVFEWIGHGERSKEDERVQAKKSFQVIDQ